MEKALDTKEISNYLKTALKLEISVYTQQKAIDDAEKELRSSAPVISKVKKETVPVPVAPTVPTDLDFKIRRLKTKSFLFTAGMVLLAVGILFLLYGLINISNSPYSEYTTATLLGASVPILIGLVLLGARSGYKNLKSEISKITNEYEKQKKRYLDDCCNYEKRKATAEEKYKADRKEARDVYNMDAKHHKSAEKALIPLKNTYEETKSVLQQLYDFDILFPKYRNVVAVATMYEYFASGRISKLEGPDGAYNLYESELRLDLIINKMDVIITQLEEIKQNQYSLYHELKRSNEVLEGIASDVSNLVSTTREIAHAANITAYCSYVTAQNSEALKYIALING